MDVCKKTWAQLMLWNPRQSQCLTLLERRSILLANRDFDQLKRLLLFLVLATAVTLALIIPGRVAAQATITVTPGTTYQTWRGFSMGETAQALAYAGSAGGGCRNPITITAAQRDQIYQ